jgi:hypothetical protein
MTGGYGPSSFRKLPFNGEVTMVSEKSSKISVALVGQTITGYPGEIISVYGHQFTIQPNGKTAVARIHKSFVKGEVLANRVRVIEPVSSAGPVVHVMDAPAGTPPAANMRSLFNLDIKNFFGMGSLDRLITEIKKFKDEPEIIKFAETYLDLKIPANISINKMCNRISEAINLQNQPTKIGKPKIDTTKTKKGLEDIEKMIKNNKKEG